MSAPAWVARNLEEATGFGPCALTIGNFDGVHLGHRALLRATVEAARSRSVRPAVMMFSPHPACIVAPERAPRLLTSAEERCGLMADLGIEAILILPFTAAIARMTPEEFAAGFLTRALQARVVVVGGNFRFGNKAAGNTQTLAALGSRLGFETQFLAPVKWRGLVASASEVRKRIAAGEVSLAGRLLDRPYAISGRIVAGRGIGARQTVPTLNLETDAQVIPPPGVYITRTTDLGSGRRWNSITNIGYRPTFEVQFGKDEAASIETFLLATDGGTPAADAILTDIHLEFLRRVRDERKFGSPEALKTQILADVARAKTYFRRLARWVSPAGAPTMAKHL